VRRLASIFFAAALVAASGCCFGGEAGACVVDTGWGPSRCEPYQEQLVCAWSEPQPELPPLSVCGGTFHGGEHCSDLGFTTWCDGGYYVRAGYGC
jgi:hypothetical protein